jgi:UDP-glucose 4-epimerase
MNQFSLRGARVLVTGVSGYIGQAVAARLIESGASVAGLSRTKPREERGEIDWVQGDVADNALLESLFKRVKPELIFHLAGVTNAARHLDRVLPSFMANALGTVTVLDACARHGCKRFIYCASMEEPRLASDTPSSPYGASKWVGSAYTRMFNALFSVPSVIVRPYFVYGPGHQSPEKLVPHIVRSYLLGTAPRLSSPNRGMDWVYIDDTAEAFVRAGSFDSAIGCEIDVGTGRLATVREFAELVGNTLNIQSAPNEDPDQLRTNESSPVADLVALEARLHWTPTMSLEEGIRRTVEWYRSQPLS